MKIFKVTPHFTLTEEMYERARARLATIAPEVSYTCEQFVDLQNWMFIPDPNHPEIHHHKAEQTVLSGPPYKRHIKVNVWHSADLRRTGEPVPHNHPWWPVESYIEMGGYLQDAYILGGVKELRDFAVYTLENANLRVEQGQELHAGGTNVMPHLLFHEVTKVLEPGRTLTVMDCGKSKKEAWGYLNPDTLRYENNKRSPIDEKWPQLVRSRNPHLRKN
jgi:hypothetical protein